MRIAIVGFGIGGATAAAALIRRGMTVKVFERAAEIREVGAGVATLPNTIRLYTRLGLGEALARIGCQGGERGEVKAATGEVLHYMERPKSHDGVPGYSLHRAELLEAIASLVPRESVHVGMRCVDARETNDAVELRFENGHVESFDLVIGADGIHSVVRDAVLPSSPPTFANLVAYRGLVPLTAEIGAPSGLWTDRVRYFVAYPVSSGRLINFVGVVPTHEEARESWSAEGRHEDLAATFEGWDPQIQRIIAAVEKTFLWGLYYRDPPSRMVTRRIAMLGDAIHPMLIHAGQGAGQAIEDGFALGVLLEGCASADVPDRLQLYQQLRLPRASAVQEGSRRNAEFLHKDFPMPPGRERPLRTTPIDWIADYDVEREAENMLREGLPTVDATA